MSARLEVQVLGPLQLRRAGATLEIGSPLQRRLLTALVLADGSAVSTDRLLEVLWGDTPPAAARNSLQSHVARLRRALGGGEVIATTAAGYRLEPHSVEVDAVRFERVLGSAAAALDGDPATVVTSLSEALAWWRGPAFAGLADDLAHDAALRLERLRGDARQLLAEAQRRTGQLHAAIDGFGRLVVDEPLREDVAAGYAAALAAAGRLADALAAVRAFQQRLTDELGLDPTPAFAELERRLLRGDVDPPSATLPVAPPDDADRSVAAPTATAPPRLGTPTVGRAGDLDRLEHALGATKLVTLVGPGGVGKTRLATVLADSFHLDEETLVAWIDLARVTHGHAVPSAILEGLGVAGVDPADRAAVGAAVGGFRGLVVLDCCEHVLDAVADVVDRALARSGPARLLATARERLDVPGEQVVAIAPLVVPAPADATDDDPAVALFQDRIAAVGGARVAPTDAARVAAAVDGLPLAIELAAARAAAIPVDELLDRLTHHLDILAGTSRRHGGRQRTMTSVIDWSHDLLDEHDRIVFRRLSVFAAAFRLADAERIVVDDEVPVTAVADALTRLVDRSMVSRQDPGSYRLLEPLRLYAADQLTWAGDRDATERRHRDAFLSLAAELDRGITGPDEVALVAVGEAALPDLRAVQARALARRDLATVAQLTAGLYRFSYLQGRIDVLTWGTDLADGQTGVGEVDDNDRLRAVAAAAIAAGWRGSTAQAQHLCSRYADRVDDLALTPWARATLSETVGDLAVGAGDLELAAAACRRYEALAQELGHDGLRSLATASASVVATFDGRPEDGAEQARTAIAAAERCGAPSARSLAYYALGEALADRDPPAALAAFDTAIRDASRVRARFLEGIARTADVAVRGRHGDPVEALERYRSALQVWQDAGADGPVTTTLRNLVVLLARIGADEAALTIASALERLGTTPSYGPPARHLRSAVDAASERAGEPVTARASTAAAELSSLDAVVRVALGAIELIHAAPSRG